MDPHILELLGLSRNNRASATAPASPTSVGVNDAACRTNAYNDEADIDALVEALRG